MKAYFIKIPAILMGVERIILMAYSIVKVVTLFSLLKVLLDVSSLKLYEFYFFIGVLRIVMAVYDGTTYEDLQKKSEFIQYGIVLILASFIGLVIYVLDDTTVRINLYWTIETIVLLAVSILLLIGIKK